MFTKFLQLTLLALLFTTGAASAQDTEQETREILSNLILAEGEARDELVIQLEGRGDLIIKRVAEAWRVGEIFSTPAEGDSPGEAFLKLPLGFESILTGEEVTPATEPEVNRASRSLRKVLSGLVEALDLESPDPATRIATVEGMGLSRDLKFLPLLEARLDKQKEPEVREAFDIAIALLRLDTEDEDQLLKAITRLGELKVYPARDRIEAILNPTDEDAPAPSDAVATAATEALEKIDSHKKLVELAGTAFRGLSLGSVLLLIAYGLAITFGLMGVINMAHGEFIAIGGYTVFLIQGVFERSFGVGSAGYEMYFLVALPCAFLTAAFFGILLERGVIRFLYKRPLESLLATWGISMVLQQLFRIQFGAANVAVSSPNWLSGSFEVGGVLMSNNRLFVIAFAVVVIVGTWLLLTRTNWGLHVRATMQNRVMASCVGVRSARVNMLTFAFGSGLAGLAGAFLSQIGNVGPSMGQAYIVDSFMVVVIGGVGNLVGTAISSLGIGMVDQILQPLLGPVMGKITVLFSIILFLQFKPGGLFPARTRSLDD